VLAKPSAGFSRAARLITHHQRAANAFFQQPDPLRNGRRRDIECAGCPIEAAFSDDSSQSGQGGIVEHDS